MKSLLSYISKEVSTSGVTSDEKSIRRAQQLDLIYALHGILYKIIPEEQRSNTTFPKPKLGPHADGVAGSIQSPNVESLTKHIHELSVKQSAAKVAKDATPSP